MHHQDIVIVVTHTALELRQTTVGFSWTYLLSLRPHSPYQTANCSLTSPIPIIAYTIYFHLQHIVCTASQKDNMVISYLTLNIISTKTVSSIAVASITDDHCFFYIIYYTHMSCNLYHYYMCMLCCSCSCNMNSFIGPVFFFIICVYVLWTLTLYCTVFCIPFV